MPSNTYRKDTAKEDPAFSSNAMPQMIRALLNELGKDERRGDLIWLGKRLGELMDRAPFTYQYLHSVLHGNLKAGAPLVRAVKRALIVSDGTHPLMAKATEQTVMSIMHIDGLFVLGKKKVCANPDCFIEFVDNHPRRKYCPFCSS